MTKFTDDLRSEYKAFANTDSQYTVFPTTRERQAADIIDALVAAMEACRGAMSEESPLWSVTTEEYDEIKAKADAALALAHDTKAYT